MPDLFLYVVIILFVLAIVDLMVGVSNDAVNFLNSAIGSQVASRRTIMIVASLGIFFGASFSGGIMEVARKGIFNPELFYFYDIMFLFLAVMLTDIILLDAFNTLGLPTSTTVSIVFELLGAAVAIAAIKTFAAGGNLAEVGEFINSSGALTIIAGIFLSVGVAFTVGALVQYISRLLFTFNYEKKLQWVGTIWSGIALSLLTYFLLFKGLKGSGFISGGTRAWIEGNTWLILGAGAVFWTLIMGLLHHFTRVHILKVVVLFGTFSLAMAFAGNDLVNFIGVPVAGFESYNAWIASGEAPKAFPMTVLSQSYPTKVYLLVGAGIIMILTLWYSKKARSVTETEVNLGRQSEGLERFSPSWLSRAIVRGSYRLSQSMTGVIPDTWLDKAEDSFTLNGSSVDDQDGPPPAFDLVRASVNLTVASALIALATSYKLPLSTTYVSFMVAMGTSLSDRAWGRDSAVYRVSGVISVIGGWFATALIAFTVAGIFAILLHRFQIYAVGALVLLAAYMIYRSFSVHRKRESVKARREALLRSEGQVEATTLIEDSARDIAATVATVRQGITSVFEGLLREDRRQLREADRQLEQLQKQNEEFKYGFYGKIKRINELAAEGSRTYLLVFDLMQDFLQSANFITDSARSHVDNLHAPLLPDQRESLQHAHRDLDRYLVEVEGILREKRYQDVAKINEAKHNLFTYIEQQLAEQADDIKDESVSAVNSLLYFSLLLEMKDVIAVGARFVKLFRRLDTFTPETPWTLVAGKN